MAVAMPVTGKIVIESSKTKVFLTLEATFGDGYTQVAKAGINNAIDKWSIVWDALTESEMLTVQAALDSTNGVDYLTWTPCNETVSKKFRITKDGYTRTNNGRLFKIVCPVVQIFDII